MINNVLISLFSLLLLAGCSSTLVGPLSAGKDNYVFSQQHSSFSFSKEDTLAAVFSQANKFCDSQKRYMKVEHLNEYIGFFGNDSKTTLVFSCPRYNRSNTKAKAKTKTKTTKATTSKKTAPKTVETQSFPAKGKLTKYAF